MIDSGQRSDQSADAGQVKGRKFPQPVDVSDGIPDRVANPSSRRFAAIVAIFAAWIGVLILALITGRI